jgi:RNA-binding protein 5/10
MPREGGEGGGGRAEVACVIDGHRRHRDGHRDRGMDDDDYYGGRYPPHPPPTHRGSCARRGRCDDGDDDPTRKKSRMGGDDVDGGGSGGGRIPPRKRVWPPHFESSGASFIFDVRSGMFYEPSSDFFYDPKTKLYYSNARRQYYRYDPDKRPYVFRPIGVPVVALDATGPGPNSATTATAAEEWGAGPSPPSHAVPAETRQVAAETKSKIAISLKTPLPPKDPVAKSLVDIASMEKAKLNQKNTQRQSFIPSPGENAAGTLPQAHKKHADDMTKWSERVKEMRNDEDGGGGGGGGGYKTPATAKSTASGQPICVICRRKFADMDKLLKHERLSELHKENLAKKAASDAAATVAGDGAPQRHESEASYRDRSKERRMMHGSNVGLEPSHSEALLAHSLGSSSVAEVVRPEDTLNDANVGNQLLQKMGWKSGESLGRNSAQVNTDGSATDVASTLKNDWEKIESMAVRGGRR